MITVVWWQAIPVWILCLVGTLALGYLLGKGHGRRELDRVTQKLFAESHALYQARLETAKILEWQSRDTIGRSDPGAET